MSTPEIDVAQQVADKVIPIVMANLHAQRDDIKATLSLVDRIMFPVVFPLLMALVPGIILTSLREAFTVRMPFDAARPFGPPLFPKGVTCPKCGLFFAANPPPGGEPVSMVFCPKCATTIEVFWP